MPRTNNENLISGTQAERISVSLDAEQLVKDTTTQSLFVGDGSTVGGRAVDVRPVSDITGNYTLVRADEGKILRFNSASAITITIPTNANVGYPISLTRIPFINLGAGVVTLVGDTGVTLTSIEPNVDSKESGEIHKTATNTWFLTKGGSGASQLTELTDVNITNLLNTQTLQYNTTSGKWENVTSTDANTTYDLAVPASTTNLRLTGSDGSTDNVTLTGAGATSIARTSGTELTITSTNITYGVLIPTGTTSLRLLGSDSSTDDISIVGGTNTTVTRTSDSILTLASDDTTYSLATSTAGSNATIDLTAGGSGSGTDSVTLAAGSNITISETGDTITFAGTAGTVTNVTGSSPISVSSGTTTPAISISQADASTNGFLSSSDWSTFNSRLSSVGITSGGGLSVSGSPLTSNGSITLTNTGVTSNVAGTGISVSGATGAVTIANTDLGSSQNIFKTVAISGQDNIVADSNSDTLTLAEGSNITLTTNAGTDTITIAGTDTTYSAGTGIGLTGTTFSNLDKGSAQNIFKTVAVSGQSDIVADSNTDTLTFAAGSNVALTTAAGSDTLTIASTDTTYSAGSGLDLAGTTFSVDVSDFMANGANNRILTASGTDSINAESGLTFDGSTLTVGGSVIISSDLTVNGTTTTINTQTLSVDDPMVVVGDNNSANSVDLGIIGKYVDTNTYYSGLLRDASAGKFRLFTTTQDLSSATTVDPTNGGYANADLIVGSIQQSGATNGIVYADSNGNLLGGRTIAEGVGIDITNGSAVSGNPTIALDLSELTTSTSNADGDFFVVVDTGNAQKKITKANVNISGFNNDSGFTTNTGTVTSVGLAGDSGSTAITTSGTFTVAGGTNVTTSLSGSTLTIAATDTNTTYSAGDGLDLSGTTFSTDLKSNGGLVIESTELAINLGASSITGTLAISDGGTGATSAGSARTNLGLGSLATLSSVAFSNIAPAAIQLSSESFTDVDTTLMTSAAIQDKILSYGYTTNTGTTTASNTQTFTNKSGNISQWTNDSGYTTNVGDITGVTAGQSLSGGGTSGNVTLGILNNGINALQLNVSGDGSSGQKLISDGDGSFSWSSGGDITLTMGNGLSGGGSFSTGQNVNETLNISIANNGVSALQLNVSGNGSSGQALTSDGDGSFSWTTMEVGDITAITAGLGLSGGGTSGSVSLALDLHELSALGAEASTSDYVSIVDSTDNSTKKVLISNLPFGSGSGDITAVVAGAGLSGGATSGSATLSIPNQGSVSAGSYTNSNITVDARGIITDISNGSSGTVGGSDTELLYNNGGTEDGIASVTFDDTNNRLFIDTTRTVIGGNLSYSNGLTVNDEAEMRNVVKFSDGTPSAPSITRWNNGDDNTGIYFVNPDVIGFTTGGTSRMTIAANGTVDIVGTLDTTNLTIAGSQGSDGQVLTSTGSGVAWETPTAGGITGVTAGTGLSGGGTSGAVTLNIDSTVTTLTGTQTLTNKTLTDPTIRLASAYSTTPALSFTGDTNTGITHNGGNGFSFIHGGSIKTTFASTGLKINSSTYKIHADGSDKLNIWGGHDGSAAVRINDNYDLPITDGSANQVIQTNGSGTLSFVDASSGIGGSIADNQLAVGSSTSDEIEGSAGLTATLGGSGTTSVLKFGHSDGTTNYTRLRLNGNNAYLEFRDQSDNQKAAIGFQSTQGLKFFAKAGGLGATEALRITPDDEWMLNGSNVGSSGQVLTSGGSGNAVSWTTVSSGDSWSTAVDANIVPDTDNAYDIGSATNEFRHGYFDGTVNCDGINIAGNMIAGNSSLYIIGGGSQESRANIFLPNNETQMKIQGSSSSNTDIILDTRYTSGTGQILLKTKGQTRFSVGASGEFKIGTAAGTSGQVLTSGGSGAVPTWTTPSSSSGTVTSVSAGTGMTQSGTSTVNPTLNVIGGTGITANADDIEIDTSVVATLSGTQTFSGVNTFSNVVKLSNGSLSAPALSFSTQTNQGIYRIGNGSTGITSSGQLKLTVDPYGITVGDGNSAGYVNAKGTQDLILRTNNGTNSSQIKMVDGVNGDIDIDTNGSGSVRINYPTTNNSYSLIVKSNDNQVNPFHSAVSTTSTNQINTAGQFAGLISSGSRTTGFGSQIEFRLGEVNYAGYLAGKIGSKMQDTGNANFDMFLTPMGTGNISLGNFTLDADQSVGSGQDNYVMTYDNSTGLISLEEAGGGGASAIGELSDAVTTATSNIGLGSGALDSLTASSGNYNTGLGINAGTAITTGDNSVAIGYNALKSVTTQNEATAIGYLAGEDLAGGAFGSTAIGVRSLSNFTTGWGNTAVGHDAMWSENGAGTGQQNTAFGYQSMKGGVGSGVGITGSFNVSYGSHANSRLANGTANVAVGHQANNNISSGSYNIGVGMRANQFITTGSRNIAIGHEAMNGYDTENDNIAIGYDALGGTIAGGEFNIAIGNYTLDSLTSADRSIAIGYQAGTAVTTGGDHVMIGHTAGAAITNQATGVFIGYRAGVSSTGYSETIVGSQAGTNGTGYNTVVGHNAMTAGTGSSNTFIGWNAGQGVASNAANQNVGIGADSLKDLTTGSYNLGVGRSAGQNITSGQKNIILSSNNGASSLTTGSYNVLIGNADVSSATVGQSLTISDGSGTIKWIEGDNSGSVNLPNSKLKVNGSQGSDGQVLTSTGSGVAWEDAGGGSDTDSSAFKFTASSRVPMMNGMAGNITNATMNGYWAYGNLVSFTESKTLTNAWIYINSLSSGSADTGVTTALYELADSVLTDSSPNGTLIATATWAASKFVTASGSTGYNSESWVAASGQSLTLDSSKYYVIVTSNWANNQNTTTPFNILAWTSTSLPNISGSGGNVGVSNGFALSVNGHTSPATSVTFTNSGSGYKSAIWSSFT